MDRTRLAQFGDRLRRARLALDLSRSAFATRAGIARNTLAALERGSQHPSPATLAALARALGLPEQALIGVSALAPSDPRLEHLNDEDLQIAQAFHHAPTPVKARVLRVLDDPTRPEAAAPLNEVAQRLADLDPGQRAAVLRLVTEFERMPPPPDDGADDRGRPRGG